MNQIINKQPTAAERFTTKVLAEFSGNVGAIALTDFQKRLVQNYFIGVDAALKVAELARLKKAKKYQDAVPVTWDNVNLEQLSKDVIAAARIGFDPAQDNHINLIPFKNNALNNYSITFIKGYRGIELKAKKYGLDIPDHVVVELVYSNDKFKSYKKDRNNTYETYEFEVVDDFDRGDLKGGFYYHVFVDRPEKNKLVVFSVKDIEKRKPKYASVDFWGGYKDIYEEGEKTGKKELVEGWKEKMWYKTIYRAAYNDITIDSQKIDDDYMSLKQTEAEFKNATIEQEIAENANIEMIDIQPQAVEPEQKAEEIIQTEIPIQVTESQNIGMEF